MKEMIEFSASGENVLSILASCLDIIGACLLARALVCVRSAGLMKQAISGFGGVSPDLLKMFAEQKVDGFAGLGFLLVGFIVQGLAGYGFKSSSLTVLVAGLFTTAVAVCIFMIVRTKFSKSVFVRACQTWRPRGTSEWSDEQIEQLWSDAKEKVRG